MNFTIAEIDQHLKTLPSEIASQAKKAEEARMNWDMAKAKLEVAKATAMIMLDDGTVELKKARVVKQTQEAQTMVIEAESDYRCEDINLKQLEDLFTSVRKAVSIREMEINHLSESINERRNPKTEASPKTPSSW